MKSVGKSLYAGISTDTDPKLRIAYQRVSASDLRLPESWFRDAVFADPELVIGPCREAGRVPSDETWLPWATEFNFGAGPVDVLLVSSRGRLAVVETKLSYNTTKRREAVAQLLDYALSLQETPYDDLPPLPASHAAPEAADLHDCLTAGRFLLVVAGDVLDPRAVRLSEALLAGHLTSEWDLAMVDLNVYRSTAAADQILLVPELRGMVLAETRQVVRVQVEGEAPRARVSVERLPADDFKTDSRPKLTSVNEFLACVHKKSPENERPISRIVERFQEVDRAYSGRFVFGLQAATANLYWRLSTGPARRIFAMSENGRFRVARPAIDRKAFWLSSHGAVIRSIACRSTRRLFGESHQTGGHRAALERVHETRHFALIRQHKARLQGGDGFPRSFQVAQQRRVGDKATRKLPLAERLERRPHRRLLLLEGLRCAQQA